MRKKILFICGVINQTTQLHKIAQHLPDYDCYFTTFYVDGYLELLRRHGMLEYTGIGDRLASRTFEYMRAHNLHIDVGGGAHDYDLVVTCSDLFVQKNIRGGKLILVQEGMTDPENLIYQMVKTFRLPLFLASTAATGLSHAYDYFCVASEGYRDLFVRKGVRPATIRVTGIPNFDDCARLLRNDFPYHGFVLVATSDMRETFKFENRKAFIRRCLEIADGRPIMFKLHPNERVDRARREIAELAPEAIVFDSGNIDPMIANCDVLITRYSSVVYIGLALGKEVYSDFDLHELTRMMPIQNGGTSARNIAQVCRLHVEGRAVPFELEEILSAGEHAHSARAAGVGERR